MKSIHVAALLTISLFACSKKEGNEQDENPCSTVPVSAVPQVVQAAFTTRYSPDTVIAWFRKDSVGYYAYFRQNGMVKKMAEFDNAGAYVKEEKDEKQTGNHEDSNTSSGNKITAGCECEIPE